MKDKLGNEVVAGDVLLETGVGFGSCEGKRVYFMKLWRKPIENDGSGVIYNIDGYPSVFKWASVKNSIKVDFSLLPDNFEYSFLHGMSDLDCKLKEGSLVDLINNSDWINKQVKKEDVDRFNFLRALKIETVDDIIANIDELKKGGYIPRELMDSVLSAVRVSKTNPDFGNYRGEIGMAYLRDMVNYECVIRSLAANL